MHVVNTAPKNTGAKHGRGLFAIASVLAAVTSSAQGAPFTPGNVVVLVAGDGTRTIAGAVPTFINEYSAATAGQTSPVQSIALPTADSGSVHAITEANGSLEGAIALSGDGRYFTVSGYDTPPATTPTATGTLNRTIGRIDLSGNIDTSTVGNFGGVGSTLEETYTTDGSGIYYVDRLGTGSTQQIGYVPFGGSIPTVLNSTLAPTAVHAFSGQLYVASRAASTVGVYSVGTGLPASGTPTLTPVVVNESNSRSVFDFYMADLSPTVPGLDTLYISNAYVSGTGADQVSKYSLVNGSWVFNGSIHFNETTGLSGTVSNGNVTLFVESATSDSTPNATVLSTVTDTAGYNAAPSTAVTVLASLTPSGTNEQSFRGVAVVPVVNAGAWAIDSNGNWSGATVWSGNTPSNPNEPNAPGATATFGAVITAPRTVTVDYPQTVGLLNFTSPISYTLAGNGTFPLTLTESGTTAAINVSAGSHTITTLLTYTAGLNVTTAAASSVTLPLNIIPAGTLTKAGAGTLAFNASGSGIAMLALPAISINGGTLALDSNLTSTNRTLLLPGNLNISGGRLDLGNNDLDLQGGNLTTINNLVQQGYSRGTWNGSSGITSSAAFANATHLTALGVIQNSTNGNTSGPVLYTGFDGTTGGASTDVLAKYTYCGDANLDGKVDGTDYSRIDNGYLSQLTGWFNGDFNYDNTINGSDYTLIDNAFNVQGAQITAAIASPTAQMADGTASTAVPEPATLGLLSLAALALGRRRRPN